MATQKERFLSYLQSCVKSTRATDTNPLFLGGNAPKDYSRFLESDRLFDYNPSKWSHITSMYEINDYSKALEIFNELVSDKDFVKRDKDDNQGWRRGAISHYVCFLSAQEFFRNKETGEDNLSSKHNDDKDFSLQQIYYGAPGTGKSHSINEQTEGESVIRTTFHPDSDYSTFVGAYKPTTKKMALRDVTGKVVTELNKETGKVEEVTEDRIVYEFVDQAFLQAYVNAWKFYAENPDSPKKQYLIIEEINRGNCAQIFGDLFQLLDRNEEGFSSYDIKPDTDIKKYIMKQNLGLKEIADSTGQVDISEKINKGDLLSLPPNLYIWATMNTSDQSLFPIDSAFKRRWDWKYVPIAKGIDEEGNEMDWKVVVNGNSYDWWSFLEKVNEIVEDMTSSEDKQLGYFFCKAENDVISAEKFVGKVIFYLWNDVFKDYGLDRDEFKYEEDGKKKSMTFRKFFNADGSIDEKMAETFLKNLKLEPSKTSAEEFAADENQEEGKGENKSKLVAVTVNGERLTGENRSQFELYLETIKRLGVENVAPVIENMKYRRKGCTMATKTPEQAILNSNFSYVELEGYHFVKGAMPYTLIRILEDLKDELNLDIEIEFK